MCYNNIYVEYIICKVFRNDEFEIMYKSCVNLMATALYLAKTMITAETMTTEIIMIEEET